MTTPDRPPSQSAPDARWWIKPALISLLNVAAILIVVTFFVGWSTSAIVIVLAGFAFGTWWFVDQRPSHH